MLCLLLAAARLAAAGEDQLESGADFGQIQGRNVELLDERAEGGKQRKAVKLVDEKVASIEQRLSGVEETLRLGPGKSVGLVGDMPARAQDAVKQEVQGGETKPVGGGVRGAVEGAIRRSPLAFVHIPKVCGHFVHSCTTLTHHLVSTHKEWGFKY
jgi:hypothetical protein